MPRVALSECLEQFERLEHLEHLPPSNSLRIGGRAYRGAERILRAVDVMLERPS
jgi:hypothetical protein